MECYHDGCDERATRLGACSNHDFGDEDVYEPSAPQRQDGDVTTAEQPHEAKYCSELTKQGKPCKAWAMIGSDLCSGHAGRGLAASPEAAAAAGKQSAANRQAQARSRDEQVEKAQVGVRRAVALRLAERIDDVVRLLVDEPIANGDKKTLLEALNQALGRPTETVVTEVRRPQSLAELDSMTFEERLALLKQLQEEERRPLQLVKSEAAGA